MEGGAMSGCTIATRPRRAKPGQVWVSPHDLQPAPENERIYDPVTADTPDNQSLIDSVREHGVRNPIVATLDNFIVGGHRRRFAAIEAGLDLVPVNYLDFRRADDPDRFLQLLVDDNEQRDKKFHEKLHEQVVKLNPDEAYEALIEHRQQASAVKVKPIKLGTATARNKISSAKMPMLRAIIDVINERKKYWPLTDRAIHYALLNDPPLRHASKPGSRYVNNRACWKDLCDMLTRARLEGHISFDVIADTTRPVTIWDVHQNPRSFLREQLDNFGKGYSRDLLQSQPNHIEIVGEKNTLGTVLNQIAGKYCITTMMGRGFASFDSRYRMSERFKASGRDKLVVLIISDFDPDGEQIAESFARSMRDEFHVDSIHAIRVGLTIDQVKKHNLPVGGKASAKKSPNLKKFLAKYDDNVYEVEALDPDVLQQILTATIDSVIDRDAFNREIDEEKRDAVHLAGVRRMVVDLLKDAKFHEA
jgi:hypothetical protein